MMKIVKQIVLAWCVLASMSMAAQQPLRNPSATLQAEIVVAQDRSALVLSDAQGKEIVRIDLGLRTTSHDYASGLTLDGISEVTTLHEEYRPLHGKSSHVKASAHVQTAHLKTADGAALDVEMRLYDDGLAFRYLLGADQNVSGVDSLVFTEEVTTYHVQPSAKRWLQSFVAHYEGDFPLQDIAQPGTWGYPALFQQDDTWMLITEAGADRNYCLTRLDNHADANSYQLTYPDAWQGNGVGEVLPASTIPWHSPWRLVLAGSLSDIVASNLVETVAPPTTMTSTDWIRPGRASWVYWAYNHGTKDYQLCRRYVDLAVAMGWEYVLFDWEWDAMTNGGRLEDAVAYARSKGVAPWMWYNSGGPHNRIGATPRDRMLTHENRLEEFAWLKKIGIVGVKIDFFESDKQHMVNYYLDILEDAAAAQLMVNFHGATLPRGWSRTYPHLMSMEAVYGAEQYNNAPRMTEIAARLNCTLPFTRNVVGPMDYTPVTFTDSQHPHHTTNTHELALSVVFESGVQHMADRPEGFLETDTAVQGFLRQVPAAWDETRLLAGYPGDFIVLARRKGTTWYVAGLNGSNAPRTFEVDLSSLLTRRTKALLFSDGDVPRSITTADVRLTPKQKLRVNSLPQGGFVCVMTTGGKAK